MILLKNLDNLPTFNHPIITLGSFDGLHIGHKTLIHSLIQEADKINGDKIIITLNPHPREFLYPSQNFKILTTIDEKIERFQKENIDFLLLIPFDQEFSNYTPTYFFENIIIKKIGAEMMIIGKDHSFGKNASGNADLLCQLASLHQIKIIETPEVTFNKNTVHSSKIRKFIKDGDFKSASEFLGYNYSAVFKIESSIYNQYFLSLKNPHKQLPEAGRYPVHIDEQKGFLNIISEKIILETSQPIAYIQEIKVIF